MQQKLAQINNLVSYKENLTNIKFWLSYINFLADKHSVAVDPKDIAAGYNGTYPVFVVGDYVFKFFGFRKNWQDVYEYECKSHAILDKDDTILAPKLLFAGDLFADHNVSKWSYIISTRISGQSYLNTDLNYNEKLSVAADIGQIIKKVHSLNCNWQFDIKFWQNLDIVAACRQSILPVHLIDQINSFMQTLAPFDLTFVNSDIVEPHVFIENKKVSGIIDWGDAAYTDRHYELGKLHLNVFDADKGMLSKFLNAANWPVTKNFARQSLGMALYRQAVGLIQHNTFDVFYKLPHLMPINEIKTLDELADILFLV